MSEHHATIRWHRETPDFDTRSYNRDHDWIFDAPVTIRASANPAYRGNDRCVDPEEAFVASLSSCHMLTFLALASMKGFTLDDYEDEAIGQLGKAASGELAMLHVALRPRIVFSGDKIPTPEEIRQLHDDAHHRCFIANSVKTEVVVEPR